MVITDKNKSGIFSKKRTDGTNKARQTIAVNILFNILTPPNLYAAEASFSSGKLGYHFIDLFGFQVRPKCVGEKELGI